MPNNLDKQYLDLLQDILDNGTKKVDRTGTGTISVFGRQIRHKMSDGFPLLTTKRVAFSQVKSELAWFLAGSSDIRVLWKSNNHIWDGDTYKNYVSKNQFNSNPEWLKPIPLENGHLGAGLYSKEEFIEKVTNDSKFGDKWGDLGPIYGKQWRDWNSSVAEFEGIGGTDQIQNILDDLINNPDSRRMIVSAWNVGEIDQMTLPPCHNFFQVYTKELSYHERYKLADLEGYLEYQKSFGVVGGIYLKDPNKEIKEIVWDKQNIPKRSISLMWNQRSVDTPLGLPFNIASYGTLLEMLAQEVNMVPDELIGNLGDVHIYLNQIEGVKEQLTRESRPLPTIQLQDGMHCHLTGDSQDIVIKDYNPHPRIDFPLSN